MNEYKVMGSFLGRETTVIIRAKTPEKAIKVAAKFYRLTDAKVVEFHGVS